MPKNIVNIFLKRLPDEEKEKKTNRFMWKLGIINERKIINKTK